MGKLFGLAVDGLAVVVPSGLAVGVDDVGESEGEGDSFGDNRGEGG